MAEIKVRGRTITFSIADFEGLEGSELDREILKLRGVGDKLLDKARGLILEALADEILVEADGRCRNFSKCGNQAEEDYPYCVECHFKWRTKEAKRKDGETRPLRASVEKWLESARRFYARYYQSDKPAKWKDEVRESFAAAEAALAEGDRFAREAMDRENPSPWLFKVARAHFYLVKNHLSTAEYHSARISIKGLLKGVPNYAQKKVRAAMKGAEESFAAAEGLSGRKLTRQLATAASAMQKARSAAQKERDRLNKADPRDFYGKHGKHGRAIGDQISEEQLKELDDLDRRRKRLDRKEQDRARDS